MDKYEQELRPDRIRVWPSIQGCWIAGLSIGGKPCFFIGGFGLTDPKLYGSYYEALAAIVAALGNERTKAAIKLRAYKNFCLVIPPQEAFAFGCHILELQGSDQPILLAIGPNGPTRRIYQTFERAELATRRVMSGLAMSQSVEP